MPPRLPARTLLLVGAGLLAASVLLTFLVTPLVPALSGSPSESQAWQVLLGVVQWVQQIALLVGAGLVAGSFVVRALGPQEPTTPTAAGSQGHGRAE